MSQIEVPFVLWDMVCDGEALNFDVIIWLYCFVQPSSETASAMCVELFPAQESTALKTLLEAAVKSSIPENSMNRGSAVNLNEVSCDLPVPSPKPTPTLVSQYM